MYNLLDGVNLLLGLNSLTLQIFIAIISVCLSVIFTAGSKDQGYFIGLITFPFINLMAIIGLSLGGLDFTLSGILFWIGIVIMSFGIYITRNNEVLIR